MDMHGCTRRDCRFPSGVRATGCVLVPDVDPRTRQVYAHARDSFWTLSSRERVLHGDLPWLDLDAGAMFAELRF